MLRALEIARQYHPHIGTAGRGGWKDLAHLLSDPGNTISAQMIHNWRTRKLPARIDYFIAKKLGCSVEELRGLKGASEDETIDEESMTPEERLLIASYRRSEPEKQAALFRLITGQSRPPVQTGTGVNVVPFNQRRKK